MTKILFLVLALFAGSAFSATVALQPPANVVKTSTGWATAGSAAFNGASFNSALTTQVAGKVVTVPTAWRLAANAGQFAVSAARMTPTALVVGAVASWLLEEGLQYINGQWVKQTAPVPAGTFGTPAQESDCASRCASQNGGAGCGGSTVVQPAASTCAGDKSPWYGTNMVCLIQWPNGSCSDIASYPSTQCPVNYTYNNGLCVGAIVPASEADFANAANRQLTDPAAQQLAEEGQPLPLQNPQPNTTPQDIPLSDPRIDPVTNKPVRDVARVTPQADGKTADVQIFEQPLNPDGTPEVDPGTGNPVPPQTKEEDPCVLHPERIGCIEEGEAPDEELPTLDMGSTINPVGMGGGGGCPADKQLTYLGKQITFSYGPICQGATWLNPVVLAISWLLAGYILIGALRES